jgi:biotin carboxyl carrier protein
MIIDVLLGEEEEPRRYELRRNGNAFLVNTSGDEDEVSIDWRRPEPGIYSLIVGRSSYEVFVEENDDYLTVHLLNRTFRVRAADARRRRAGFSAEAADGAARIVAPIPGRVTKILKEEGSTVERGEGVIVVEAMKMENELRAPRAGTVVSVAVAEGDGVEGGALLATIE